MPTFLNRLMFASILLAACTAHAAFATDPNTAAGAAQAVAASTSTSAPANSSPGIPLKDALNTLEPHDVFENFYLITQVPRPSGHMDQIRAFLVDFSQGLGLETIVDDAGNVIIRKPAAAGMENRARVVLQAHMDMVPQTALLHWRPSGLR